MNRYTRYLILSIGLGLGTVFGWRLLSRRYALPCPSWLTWLLENPYVDTVASANHTITYMNLEPGMAILDVGCGPGRLTIPLAMRVGDDGRVVGLDIQPAMLNQVRRRVDMAGLTNVQLVYGEASSFVFVPNTFDRAVLVTVLGEIPDRRAALAAIFDALKPGGMLTITEVLPDPHYQRVRSVREFAAGVGFTEDRYDSSGLAYTISFAKPGSREADTIIAGETRSAATRMNTLWDVWRARYQDRRAIEERQQTRLQQMIAFACTHSEFYREHYADSPSTIEELCQLPPVTKPELMANFDAWVTDPTVTKQSVQRFVADEARIGQLLQNRYAVWTTSGTTGEPGIFLHDETALAVYDALLATRGWLVWITPREFPRILHHGFREAVVAATGGHFAAASNFEHFRQRYRWLSGRLHTFSVLLPLPELVAQLNAYQPTVLFGYASVLQLLALEQTDGRLKIRPAVLTTGGESLFPEARARIEGAFDCQVRNVYGASEFIYIACECPRGGLHINADWAILEPVDQHYRPVSPGQSAHTVLLTNLANRVQPIIRYDLGDSVTLLPVPCSCGSPLPTMRIEGRQDDILTVPKPDGELVHLLPMALSTVIEETPGVQRFQLIQMAPTILQMRLDVTAGASKDEVWLAARQQLHAYLTAQGLPDLHIEQASESPSPHPISGKFRHVWNARSERSTRRGNGYAARPG